MGFKIEGKKGVQNRRKERGQEKRRKATQRKRFGERHGNRWWNIGICPGTNALQESYSRSHQANGTIPKRDGQDAGVVKRIENDKENTIYRIETEGGNVSYGTK